MKFDDVVFAAFVDNHDYSYLRMAMPACSSLHTICYFSILHLSTMSKFPSQWKHFWYH